MNSGFAMAPTFRKQKKLKPRNRTQTARTGSDSGPVSTSGLMSDPARFSCPKRPIICHYMSAFSVTLNVRD
jgi:hypothetical protein